MDKYKNTRLRPISFEGNTINDAAHNLWNSMNWEERLGVMNKVENFKTPNLKQRACVNYLVDSGMVGSH